MCCMFCRCPRSPLGTPLEGSDAVSAPPRNTETHVQSTSQFWDKAVSVRKRLTHFPSLLQATCLSFLLVQKNSVYTHWKDASQFPFGILFWNSTNYRNSNLGRNFLRVWIQSPLQGLQKISRVSGLQTAGCSFTSLFPQTSVNSIRHFVL